MREKIIIRLNLIIETIIKLMLFLVPLYFSFIYQDFLVFSLDKTVIFRMLVEVLLILTIIKILIKKKANISINKRYLLLVFLFFLAFIIATIFSIDPYNSFWGSYWRQQGLFTYLHYLFFFLILAININSREKIEKIINFVLLASLLVSLYGILQWLGIDNFPWQKPVPAGGRVFSTFGQPVFLGNYLVLVIFLTFYRVFISKEAIFRFFYLILLLTQLLCLLFTLTRGAWLGFMFGIIFILFLYYYIYRKNKVKFVLVILSIILIAFSSFYYFSVIKQKNFQRGNINSYIIYRINSLLGSKYDTVKTRLKYWTASIDAIGKKPLLGYGPENQQSIIVRYYDPEWPALETINTSPDRAHDELLDLLLIGGAVLAGAYLLIIILIFWRGVKYISKIGQANKKTDWLFLFILTGVFSYLAALLSSFPNTATNIYFWLYLAILLIILNQYQEEELINFKRIKSIYFYILIYAVILISLGAGYLIIYININSVRADYYFREARINMMRGDYFNMYNNYAKAMSLNNREEYYRWYFVDDSLNSLQEIESSEYRNYVINYAQDILKIDEGRQMKFFRLLRQARVYTILSRFKDKSYFQDADKAYQELIKLSPFMPDSYKDWAEMQIFAGNYNKAISICSLVLDTLPETDVKQFNHDRKKEIDEFTISIYKDSAYCYLRLGNTKEAIDIYNKIISINPYKLDIYRILADTYYNKGDFDTAIWYNKRGEALDPNNYIWPYSLAILYKESGDKEKALEYAQNALILSPDNETIKEFIISL